VGLTTVFPAKVEGLFKPEGATTAVLEEEIYQLLTGHSAS